MLKTKWKLLFKRIKSNPNNFKIATKDKIKQFYKESRMLDLEEVKVYQKASSYWIY